MAFSRKLTPDAPLQGGALDSAMVGIGMAFTASPEPLANIEDTVLAAATLGLEDGDFRVLSALVTWLAMHHERLNADRLVRLVLAQDAPRVCAPADLAQRHAGYRQRVIMGPSYRADMWALLEADHSLSPAELARRSYGSFATAWQVKPERNSPNEYGRCARRASLH